MATTTGEEKPCEPFLVLFSFILATVLNQACHFHDPVLMSYFKYEV
jgi:5-hydroxyisourate hydrolase-like protein (transthyretin family)